MSAVDRIREQYRIEIDLAAAEALIAILRHENQKLRQLVDVLSRPRLTQGDYLSVIKEVKAIEGRVN